MKHILPFLALCSATGMAAQPVLTAADETPAFGPTDVMHSAQYVAAGPAQANFTFNVGALTTGPASSGTVVAPGSTPYASSFPNATFAATPGFGFYTFTSVDATSYKYWGFALDEEDLYPNSDAEILLQLPCSMGTNWTDQFSGTGLSSGLSFTRNGTVTGHYNGYGTLVLPFGTFNNVARIEVNEDYTDVYAGMTNHYTTTLVSYMIPGHTLFTSTVLTTTVNGGSPQTSNTSSVIDASSVVGVGVQEDQAFAMGADLYPNPAKDLFSITFPAPLHGPSTCTLMDLTGREVQGLEPALGGADATTLRFDVSAVPRGMYLVRITDRQGRSSTLPLVLE